MAIFRRKKNCPPDTSPTEGETTTNATDVSQGSPQKGLLSRLTQGLKRTRTRFTSDITDLFLGKKQIDDTLLEDLETHMLTADIGVEATHQIIADLTTRVARKELSDPGILLRALQEEMRAILEPCTHPLQIDTTKHPFAILMVGVNGSGKTTTIGKLARQLQNQGKRVMLVAGDTFRAAATEQLQVWGQRNDIPVIAQQRGADSASVIFDGMQAAQARHIDVLIADTAGRLHTQANLMSELQKVKRVMGKLDPSAPHEVMLVLDAGIGQNAVQQATQFHGAIGVTGITLTKLDGTAKGGITFAIAKRLGLPLRFIGIGERIDDLRPFVAKDFVAALFDLNGAH